MTNEKDDLFGQYLEGPDSPLEEYEETSIGGVPASEVTLTPDNLERNFNRAFFDHLHRFQGMTNPYTGETYDFSEINDLSELKHRDMYLGLLWSPEDFARLRHDIENRSLPFEMFTQLLRVYLETVLLPMPSEEALRELYERSQDPVDAAVEVMQNIEVFTLTHEVIDQIAKVIKVLEPVRDVELFESLKDTWIELFQSLGAGVVTVGEYARAIVEYFPELSNYKDDPIFLKSYIDDIKIEYVLLNLLKEAIPHRLDTNTLYNFRSKWLFNTLIELLS